MTRISAALCCVCSLFAMPASAQDFLAGVRSIDVVMTREQGRTETCIASHYGRGDGYHGRKTASGERFNTYAMTAAHRTRRFGNHVTVTNVGNGRSARVRINDRGPFIRGRCIDLSFAAARAIGMSGLAKVKVQ